MMMLMSSEASRSAASEESHHVLGRALFAALAFEPFNPKRNTVSRTSPCNTVQVHTIVRGHMTPDMEKVDLEPIGDEDEFFDAVEFHDSDPENELHIAFSRESSKFEMIRGGALTPIPFSNESSFASSRPSTPPVPLDPPPAPKETPHRFICAGKMDPVLGRHRYEQTLLWRKEHNMNSILKEPEHCFELIKKHYPHYFHFQGRDGEYCYYEMPPRTDLRALREGGVDLQKLLRHYAMVTEFHWQCLDRRDNGKSIYIIDLQGIRITDFVGECVDFVRKASHFTGQHYPERAGYVFVINVPSWFKVIWNVVKPMVDEDTLHKIYILRGREEIFNALAERIPIEHIPPIYGGTSPPLGQSPEEARFCDLVHHNNALDRGLKCPNGGLNANPPCKWCSFRYARSY